MQGVIALGKMWDFLNAMAGVVMGSGVDSPLRLLKAVRTHSSSKDIYPSKALYSPVGSPLVLRIHSAWNVDSFN